MPTASKHQPAPDAPAEEWRPYLRGLGYVVDTELSPVSNYVRFHGFWVPPRLAPTPEAAAPKRAPRRKKLAHGVDPAWFDIEHLALLHRHHRDVFDALRGRLDTVEWMAAQSDDPARLEAQRTKLALGVESGMMNQKEADRRLAAWAAEQGIALPEG